MRHRLSPDGVLSSSQETETSRGPEWPGLANSEGAMPRLVTYTNPGPLPLPGCEASVAAPCWEVEAPKLSGDLSVPALVTFDLIMVHSRP